jgi:hypothetical protein
LAAETTQPVGKRSGADQTPPGRRQGEVLVKFKTGFAEPRLWDRGIGSHLLAKKRFKILSKRQNQVYVHFTSDDLTTSELLEILRYDSDVI